MTTVEVITSAIAALPPEQEAQVRAWLDERAEARHNVQDQDHESRLAERFRDLATRWKAERESSSRTDRLATHAAYQQIIGMGREAIPFLLKELAKEPDHWFWALGAITGENPIPKESSGKLKEMSQAWIRWGEERGYI